MLQIILAILGVIGSAVLIVVTSYFGVRGDVRERTAVKELIELWGLLPDGNGKKALTAEIERRVIEMAPSSAHRADKARQAHRRTIWRRLLFGGLLYGSSIAVTGIGADTPQWLVPAVVLALPIGGLLLCTGAISWLRYRRRYLSPTVPLQASPVLVASGG